MFKFIGYTYLELLLVLLLIMLMASLALTNFSNLPLRIHADANKQQVISFLQTGSALAHYLHHDVGFCLANANNQCLEQGHYLLLFNIKTNRDEKNNLIRREKFNQQGWLTWRVFPKYRHYFVFTADNNFTNSNGTLWFCLRKGKLPAWVLIINKFGFVHELIMKQNQGSNDIIEKRLQC